MRISAMVAVACISVIALSVADESEAASRRTVAIPAQGLGPALQHLAKEHGFQIVYVAEEVDSLRTAGAAGEFTLDEALNAILGGTGLTFRHLDERTVTILPQSMPGPGADTATPRSGESGATGGNERLGPVRPAGSESNRDNPSSGPGAGDDRTSNPGNPESPADARKPTALHEVEVTGSRLRSGEATDGPVPVVVFDRDKLDELGITTLPEFFRYVPQQSFVRSEESMSGAGGQYVDLRGVGTGFTAVLIDGRPAAASASSGTFNALDLNSIPMSAIERIEVLTTSASAVYGANAMGGAINIVLKRDIGRPVIDVRYGAADGGATERRVSLSAGHANGRFRGSLLLDYFDRGALLGAERDRWADQDFRRFGGTDQRSTSTNPGNVSSSTGGNLPGLSSPIAAVPEGSTGVGLTPADFEATAGQRNRDSLNRFRSIVGEQDRRSATAFGEFDLTSSVQAFAEFFHEESVTAIHLPPTAATLLVPAANEFNPFDEPVRVSYLFSGVGPRKRSTEGESDRGLVGLRGDLGAWDWEISAVRTKGDGVQRSARNSVDLARVNALLAAVPPAETLNVFQDGPGGSASLLASLVAPVTNDFEYSADTRLASAQLRGPLWQLPAGPLEIVVGGNAGNEEIDFASVQLVAPVVGDRSTTAAFAELGIPLVKPAMQVPGASSLRLTAAVRYDDYSDFGDSTNPQFGLVWTPVKALSLRFSHGTSFSPPNLFSLFAPLQEFPFFVTDPRRNNETVPIVMVAGGNPDLEAVDGESLTAGFVLTPERLPAFRFAATWWELEVDNRVTVVLPQQLVNAEAQFTDRVIRAAPSPADQAAGLPGPIVRVDITRINFGRLKTSGIDWEASYSLDTRWGNFKPSILGTWTAKYSSVELPNTPAIERVGVASTLGTIPEWKLSATLAWTRAGIGWSATARYIHSYDDAVFGLGPTGRRVDSQTLLDTQAFFNLDEMFSGDYSLLRGARITVGITNLLDESPPFSELFFDSGYDNTQGDLIGRTGYLTLTKRF